MVGGIFSEAKTKIKDNRQGERSSVCRAKLRRYLKQKRKGRAELAAVGAAMVVAERGEKKKSGPILKARFLAMDFLNLLLTFYAHCAIIIIERVHR